jgi:hypothetical protein
MSRIDQQSRRTWRLIWITCFLSLLAVGFAQVTLNAAARAADQASAEKLEGAIEDDPTVAPDSEESADNNISFPVDI